MEFFDIFPQMTIYISLKYTTWSQVSKELPIQYSF